MSYRQVLLIALGPVVGMSLVRAYAGNFTLHGFALNTVVCVAGGLLVRFIGNIGKKPDGE